MLSYLTQSLYGLQSDLLDLIIEHVDEEILRVSSEQRVRLSEYTHRLYSCFSYLYNMSSAGVTISRRVIGIMIIRVFGLIMRFG